MPSASRSFDIALPPELVSANLESAVAGISHELVLESRTAGFLHLSSGDVTLYIQARPSSPRATVVSIVAVRPLTGGSEPSLDRLLDACASAVHASIRRYLPPE